MIPSDRFRHHSCLRYIKKQHASCSFLVSSSQLRPLPPLLGTNPSSPGIITNLPRFPRHMPCISISRIEPALPRITSTLISQTQSNSFCYSRAPRTSSPFQRHKSDALKGANVGQIMIRLKKNPPRILIWIMIRISFDPSFP